AEEHHVFFRPGRLRVSLSVAADGWHQVAGIVQQVDSDRRPERIAPLTRWCMSAGTSRRDT
ncbi:hypothetical protein, partial [Streptomyces rubiginosohelvolus]